MEYLIGGDLYSLLRNVGCLEENISRIYIAEVVWSYPYISIYEAVFFFHFGYDNYENLCPGFSFGLFAFTWHCTSRPETWQSTDCSWWTYKGANLATWIWKVYKSIRFLTSSVCRVYVDSFKLLYTTLKLWNVFYFGSLLSIAVWWFSEILLKPLYGYSCPECHHVHESFYII